MASPTIEVKYDMNPNYLSEEQISYELILRGFSTKVGIEIQRKVLHRVLRQDVGGNKVYKLSKNVNLEEEKKQISSGLEEVQNLLSDTDVELESVISKLKHLIGRLSRLPTTGDNGDFRVENFMIAMALEEDVGLLVKRSPSVEENMSNQCEVSANLSNIANINLSRGIPVCQWNLCFSGGMEGLSLPNFLERVEELRLARNISTLELFNSAVDLFKGSALIWYRSVRDSVTSWDALVSMLKRDFLSPDYDSELWIQIRERKQGPKERIAIYVAVMKNLFGRLSSLPSEGEQLSIVRRNILPEIRAHLALRDVKSLEQLTALCNTLEQTIFPALYQVHQKTSIAVVEVESNDRAKYSEENLNTLTSSVNPSQGKSNVCWNCEGRGHSWRDCNTARTRFCFRCGTKNVVVPTCPKCNPRQNLN